MRKLASKKVMAATVAGLAVAGSGVAIAASQDDSPADSFLDSVARHLGISSEELRDATKAAAIDQVDQALEDGLVTEEQAEELKERIQSGEWRGFLGPGLVEPGPKYFGFRFGDNGPGEDRGGHHVFFDGKLAAAAEYLGLTEAELREQLADGKSLADVAEAQGKPVDGLKDTILDGARSALDEAVAADRLTQEQADAIYERLTGWIDELVELRFPGPLRGFAPGFGPPGFAPRDGGDDNGGGGGGSSGDALYWDTAA
jgi:hypothetical protein